MLIVTCCGVVNCCQKVLYSFLNLVISIVKSSTTPKQEKAVALSLKLSVSMTGFEVCSFTLISVALNS